MEFTLRISEEDLREYHGITDPSGFIERHGPAIIASLITQAVNDEIWYWLDRDAEDAA